MIEHDEITPFKSNDVVQEANNQHEMILNDVESLFVKVFYVVVSFSTTYAMRTNIIVLYAREFYDDTALISVFIYMSYIVSAVMSLLIGMVGNKWRFDALIIMAAISDVITFWIEATASNFWVLVIAYGIGGQPFIAIGLSWNLKMFPTYHAKQFRALLSQCYYAGIIIGPIIGGLFHRLYF